MKPAIPMLRLLPFLLLFAFAAPVQAQETKTTVKGPSGKEVKIKKEPDKLKIKGEGAGNMILDLEAVRSEIMANNQQFSQVISRADSGAMVDLYHSEARIYPQGMAAINRNQMGGMVRSFPSMGIRGIQLTTSEVIGSGDIVVETGTFEMRGDTQVVDSGKYIVIWKQEGGKWKMYRDMWNSDRMPNQ